MSPTGYAPAVYRARLSIARRARTVGVATTRQKALSGLSPLPRVVGCPPCVAFLTVRRASAVKAFVKRSSLVDPASSHMLVSKIKPCMSQCMPN